MSAFPAGGGKNTADSLQQSHARSWQAKNSARTVQDDEGRPVWLGSHKEYTFHIFKRLELNEHVTGARAPRSFDLGICGTPRRLILLLI